MITGVEPNRSDERAAHDRAHRQRPEEDEQHHLALPCVVRPNRSIRKKV
jgi:hypothetical protein